MLEPSAPKDDKEKAELKKKEEIKAEIKRMKDNNEIILFKVNSFYFK